ncbi:MAG: gliding motility-associated C-terminal domain-containing protein, partial [Bacteroidia bacterium]|nr:gliding motility-associated C-terminal domain-containing protein [Bacteroidia bacterium]
LVTPNGDGKNETFEVKGISKYPNSDLEIYNRWGNLVFSKAPYDNSWDGSANFNGNSKGKLPVGTYYFILKLNDSEGKIFKGYVQLQY